MIIDGRTVHILEEVQENIYIYFQDGPIYHCTHVPGTVAKFSSESEYNPTCTAFIDLSNFKMLMNEMINKDPDVVPYQALLLLLDINSAVCVDKNSNDKKHTRHMARRIHFVRNVEE